jgi:mannose-1-phosphate guanylyltransferase
MRAILLAAGFGTRLRPLTDLVPKCLVPVKGRPLLEIWLDRLTTAGYGPFLVNTHYLAHSVTNFVAACAYGNAITLVHENELLGTAGTLLKNKSFFKGGDGLLIHADNYCLADLDAFRFAHQHRPAGCEITMLTFRTRTPSSCGIVELDNRKVVRGFHEKVAHPPGDLANGAVYALSAAAIDEICHFHFAETDFSTGVLPRFVGRIHSYETSEVFIDVGTPESYDLANAS